jgi:hypothetical protein
MRKSFFFEGSHIHRLNQICENHKYVIQVGTSIFKYSKVQIAFLSNKALKHFRHTDAPFEIPLPSQPDNQINLNMNQLLSSFKAIDSVFRSETEITLNEGNCASFELISNILDK